MYSAATIVHRKKGNVTIEELNDELFPLHVPALIFVVVCMVVGIVGNLFVLIIYKKKFRRSNHRYFILFLAVTDLLACCTGMPFLVASLRLPYLITSDIACKTLRYFHYFVNNSSGLLLVVTAVERFRKICRPFKTQITNKQTLITCWSVIAFSAVMAAPVVALYSASPIDTGIANLTGHQCYVVDEESTQKFFLGYIMTLMTETIICICIFAVIYTFIIRTLWKNDQFLEAMRTTEMTYGSSRTNSSVDNDAVDFPSERDSDHHSVRWKVDAKGSSSKDSSGDSSSNNYSSVSSGKETNENKVTVNKSQTLHTYRNQDTLDDKSGKPLIGDKKEITTSRHTLNANNSNSNVAMTKEQVKRAASDPTLNRVGNVDLTPAGRLAYTNLLAKMGPGKKPGKHSKVTARVTVMLFTVSVFFAIAFIPHLVLMMLVSDNKSFVDELSEDELIAFQVFLRIFIINNVVNPIIYLIFDSKFRRYSIEVLKGRCK